MRAARGSKSDVSAGQHCRREERARLDDPPGLATVGEHKSKHKRARGSGPAARGPGPAGQRWRGSPDDGNSGQANGAFYCRPLRALNFRRDAGVPAHRHGRPNRGRTAAARRRPADQISSKGGTPGSATSAPHGGSATPARIPLAALRTFARFHIPHPPRQSPSPAIAAHRTAPPPFAAGLSRIQANIRGAGTRIGSIGHYSGGQQPRAMRPSSNSTAHGLAPMPSRAVRRTPATIAGRHGAYM
jgi:hypothetical protein